VLSSRTSSLPLTVVGALLAVAATAPAASAAPQRYASPTGTGDCSAASPCFIRQAIEGAGAGDEVIVASGNYSLGQTLADPAKITIHGVAGQPRPRLLFSGAGQNGLRLEHGTTLRYVRVHQSASSYALGVWDADIDQVIANAPNFTVGIKKGVIRNSIVVATASNGHAIGSGASDTSLVTLRNVTAIAPASGGVAIQAQATDSGYAGVLVRNVIARGGPGGVSLVARAVDPGGTAKITVDHSNWLGGMTDGAGASIADGVGNQSAAPIFVDAGADDYRQAAGSPTIDAGFDEFINGAFDVDGDLREIGATDIGADEFVVAPAVTTGPAGGVTDHSATLTGSVNANGVATSYWFEYGPTTGYGNATLSVAAGSGSSAIAAGAALGGLSPATTYHYRLVATNSGVPTYGTDQTFTTALPPPAPSAPASSPTSTTTTPAPAFAGVRLVSSRLTFGGRFVTLKLSCRAGTLGRCSGRTKLTAERRAGSRAARLVTLGRAPFSIMPGKQAKVRVRVTRAGRRLLRGARRLRGTDTNAAYDGAGQSRTTVAAVTVRRRQR
jgi:hypothetical protein